MPSITISSSYQDDFKFFDVIYSDNIISNIRNISQNPQQENSYIIYFTTAISADDIIKSSGILPDSLLGSNQLTLYFDSYDEQTYYCTCIAYLQLLRVLASPFDITFVPHYSLPKRS